MKTEKSFYVAELIDCAAERAALDPAFALLQKQADHAGQIAGAAVNGADAAAYWKALADKLAPCAAYAATFGAPVTVQAVAQLQASDGVNQAAALADFRAYCGLVSVGVKAAQGAAKRTAIQEFKAAEMADRAKKARGRIIKALSRALEVYGLKVDFQAVKAATCEAKEIEPEGDDVKAAKAIENAFKLDASAAIAAIGKLEPATLVTLAAVIAQAQAEHAAAASVQKVEAEAESGAVVKAEHNAIKARKAQRDAA
jgi:hypothetical protein